MGKAIQLSPRRVREIHELFKTGQPPHAIYWQERLNSMRSTEASNSHRCLLRLARLHQDTNPGKSCHIAAYGPLLQRALDQQPKQHAQPPRRLPTGGDTAGTRSGKRPVSLTVEQAGGWFTPPESDSTVTNREESPTEAEAVVNWPYLPPSTHLNPGDSPWTPDSIPSLPETSSLYLA